jgi:hypothetical protein
MYKTLFNDFLKSNDTLRIYNDSDLVFSSQKDRLLPLLDYLDSHIDNKPKVVILDKITGNAAALLSIKAGCTEVFSPMGSRIAENTLEQYSVKYHFDKTVPYIQRPDRKEMCPMEKLSLDKNPEEFYQALIKRIRKED